MTAFAKSWRREEFYRTPVGGKPEKHLLILSFSGFEPGRGTPEPTLPVQNNWSQLTSPSPRSKTRTAVRRCRVWF